MKTKSDLNALIPDIVELLGQNSHEIGSCSYDIDENGPCRCDDDPIENYFCYEQDGWTIEIFYDCFGDWDGDTLRRAWGRVTDIMASHYDEATRELSEFSESDCEDLWAAADKALSRIA